MEDTSIPPHSTGNGQPHQNPVNHTRPFFYVHPPNQQFYYHHWQFTNPYGHYGAIPGTGVPFGRPYVAPYPYMTCPGYIMPHAPMRPMDYRRMFNPNTSPGTACDVRFHPQARACRETTTSETQTEARDAVSKLMVRLGGLRASEEASEENEQDSGVVSQTSDMFLHSGQGPSREEQREDPEAEATMGGELSPPAATPCGLSSATRRVAGSSPGHVEEVIRQGVWSVGVDDGVLPLDSSSQYEESEGEPMPDESVSFPAPEKQHPATDWSNCPKSDHEENKGNGTAGIQPVCKPGGPQACGEVTPERLPSTHPAKDLEPRGDVPSPEKAGVTGVQEEPVLNTDNLPYRILRLPCDEVTTAGALPRDGPLWPGDATPCAAAALPRPGYLPSLGDGFLYSYYPPVAPERQSVLSPSLDELSSRDDMFSTDLEDVESVSGTAYVGEGMSAQAAAGASDPGDEDEGGRWEEEERPARETRLCVACGSCLNGDSRRGKSMGMGTWAYPQNDKEVVEEDEVGDGDCDGYDDEDDLPKDACESWEVPVRKLHCPVRHTQSSCVPWQKLKNAYSCEPLDPSGLEEQEQSYPRGPPCCEGYKAPTKPDKCKGPNLNGTQSRPRSDKPQGGDRVATGQENWESCGIKPRQKFWKPYPSSRGRVRPTRRRGGYKTFVPQRFRRDYNDEDEEEEELTRFQRGRGSTKRRGARY
ncbi:bucky ball-like [Anguilla rostrata]|uniref:bucky ball-like n=1 Tax=Anguilla rostrata TaxID=7938 RepID=UPI0030D61574